MNLNLYPSEAFEVTSSAITLKSLPDSIVSDLNINTELNMSNAPGLATPTTRESVEVFNDESRYDPIFVRVNQGGALEYHPDNFNTVVNSGTIRIKVRKVDCIDDYAYQTFYDLVAVPTGIYTITIKTSSHGNPDVSYTGVLTLDDPIESAAVLADALNNVTWLDSENAVRAFEFTSVLNNLTVRTVYESGIATTGRVWSDDAFFDTYFTSKSESLVFCAPTLDTEVIALEMAPPEDNLDGLNHNDSKTYGYYANEANRIALIHRRDGKLYLEMTSADEDYKLTRVLCNWIWTNEEFTELEINFDSSSTFFMVNGKIVTMFETVGVGRNITDVENIIRENPETYLKLVNGGDAYDYAEVVIFDKKQHCGSYISKDTKDYYNGSYISYDIGNVTLYNDANMTLSGEGDFVISAYDGSTPILEGYTNIDEFVEDFNNLSKDADFEADNLTIKIVFNEAGSSITGFTLDEGTGDESANNPANFDGIYKWVRKKLGYPQVPVELTDEQIYDALCEAVERYNKWRNWNENLYIGKITSDESQSEEFIKKTVDHEGVSYVIPANISENDIIDIFFQPRYTAAWFGSGSDFINDVIAQTFFSRAIDMSTNAADYYIYRLSLNDISNLIGSQLSWRIYNHRIYITPNNLPLLDQFKLGIKYRESLTVDEILNSWQIKRLTLAYAMITLGNIRGTFTSGIPAGDLTITLNSDMLINKGTELKNEVEAELKKEQRPLFMTWT